MTENEAWLSSFHIRCGILSLCVVSGARWAKPVQRTPSRVHCSQLESLGLTSRSITSLALVNPRAGAIETGSIIVILTLRASFLVSVCAIPKVAITLSSASCAVSNRHAEKNCEAENEFYCGTKSEFFSCYHFLCLLKMSAEIISAKMRFNNPIEAKCVWFSPAIEVAARAHTLYEFFEIISAMRFTCEPGSTLATRHCIRSTKLAIIVYRFLNLLLEKKKSVREKNKQATKEIANKFVLLVR